MPVGRNHADAVEAQKCRNSFLYYINKFWSVIDPGHEYIQTPLIEAIALHLQAVTEGRIMRLAISLPPGNGKSLLAAVLWPSWEWSHSPNLQSIYFSYDPELATFDGSRCRMLVESDEWQDLFRPRWTFRPDQNTKTHYINTEMGSRYSFGLYSVKKTGRRADKMVIDDSLSIDDRFNNEKKSKCINIFNAVLQSRVHNPEKMKWVIIGHRLSENDLIGSVTNENNIEKWDYLKLPAEFNPDKRCTTSIGWTDWRQERGELLFPQLYNRQRMDIIKAKNAPDDYSALYDQEPVMSGGSRFKDKWIGRWKFTDHTCHFIKLWNAITKKEDIVPFGQISFFVSVDSAVGENRTNDYSVYFIWGKLHDGRLIIVDRFKDRMSEPDSIALALSLMKNQRYGNRPLAYFAIETNGVGKPLAQNIERASIPVIGIHVHTDKLIMSTSAVVLYSNGKVHHPEKAEWLLDFENELISFPFCEHNDSVSSISIGAESLSVGFGSIQSSKAIAPAKKEHDDQMNTNGSKRSDTIKPDLASGRKIFGITRR